jgi:hypothetical protein
VLLCQWVGEFNGHFGDVAPAVILSAETRAGWEGNDAASRDKPERSKGIYPRMELRLFHEVAPSADRVNFDTFCYDVANKYRSLRSTIRTGESGF